MSSMLGTPFQITNTMIEMLFLLDHRLRAQASARHALKQLCDEIFDAVVNNFVNSHVAEDMFTPRRLYPLPELHAIFRSIFHHPALSLTDENFSKMFNMAIMSVKLQVLRCKQMLEISAVTENKMRVMRDMTGSPSLQDDVTRVKGGVSVFYSSLNIGELARVRCSVLNFFRKCNYPCSILIADGFQIENGHLVVPTNGPNAPNLGAASMYNEDGVVTDDYVLPIAGKGVEQLPPYIGENLYSSQRVSIRARNQGLPSDDHHQSNSMHSSSQERNEAVVMDSISLSRYKGDSDAHSDYSRPSHLDAGSDNESVSSATSYATRLEAAKNATPTSLNSPDTDSSLMAFLSEL